MGIDKLIEIIEDRAALEYGLRVIMEAAEKRAFPEEAYLPTFNDELLEECFTKTLELVVGKQ